MTRAGRPDWLVISRREFLERVRSPWFIVVTLLGPVLMIATIVLPALLRRAVDNRARVQVDAENYREKREQSLERLAEKVAGKVTKYRRNVTLEPMNAYERHVIHTALQDTPSVTTFSIGTEPNRRVVVSYDRTKA